MANWFLKNDSTVLQYATLAAAVRDYGGNVPSGTSIIGAVKILQDNGFKVYASMETYHDLKAKKYHIEVAENDDGLSLYQRIEDTVVIELDSVPHEWPKSGRA